MKTDVQVNEKLDDVKELLTQPREDILFFQGYATALKWFVEEEKPEGETK